LIASHALQLPGFPDRLRLAQTERCGVVNHENINNSTADHALKLSFGCTALIEVAEALDK
jgi:hypothetical protein